MFPQDLFSEWMIGFLREKRLRRVFSGILLALLLVCVISTTFSIQPAKAEGTIYIRADGTIDPSTAPISTIDNVTYIFTDNIYDSIIVGRSSIVLDGKDHIIQGTGVYGSGGIALQNVNNVTMKNMIVIDTALGILSLFSSNITISNSNIANNGVGIGLAYSFNNTVVGNMFTNDGLIVMGSYGNFVEGNLVNGKPLVYLESVSNHSVGDAGQVILVKCKNIQVENLDLFNTDVAIELWETTNTKISNNNIAADNGHGILLGYSLDNTVIGNNITANNYDGINLLSSSHNLVYHNNFIGNAEQVCFIDSVNVWDDGYPCGGNYWSDYTGIDVDGDGIGDAPYVIDADNLDRYPLMHPWSPLPVHNINTGLGYATIQEATDAPETLDGHTVFVGLGTYYENVFLYKSLTLIGEDEYDTIIDGSGVGRVIYVTSDNAKVSGFTLQHGNEGIHLYYSCNNIITYNIVNSNTWAGIVLYAHSDNCTIQGNIVSFNEEGIKLHSSNDNTINANQVVENVDGIRLDYSTGNIVSHNNATLNVYRGILLDNCENSDVRKNVVTLNSIGIMLHASEHNVMEDNKVTHNGEGILLTFSNRNIVDANEAVENGGNGIRLYNSSYNEVSHNNASIDNTGIVLETSSNNNTIVGNNVASNYNGILVGYYSDNNAIYHNNFLHNTAQVAQITSECVNFWDNSYPSGGNYWSDYNGTDIRSGPYQNETGSDGIWDHPYAIDEDNQDNYPLVSPYWYWSNPILGDINKDMKVDGKDIAAAAKAFASYPTHPKWNPQADLNHDDKIDGKDIVFVAKNWGKKYP
jgi:parallel beta-helix repeat protein